MSSALYNYTLKLADDNLVLAQRLSEWTGHGPFLEEDLALTNIVLDMFGTTRSLLEYAAKLEGKGRTEDDIAFFRNERQFLNCQICEQANGDYAKTMLRQALFDSQQFLLFTQLTKSKDETLAGIAQKAIKEISYHKRHSHSWINRFGNGTEESKKRLQDAMNELWGYTGEMFEVSDEDKELAKQGIAVDLSSLKGAWEKEILTLMKAANIEIPLNAFMHSGGRKGVHTEHLGHLLAEMQALPRILPDAKW